MDKTLQEKKKKMLKGMMAKAMSKSGKTPVSDGQGGCAKKK
jgi:hypothetical protein